MEMNFREYYDDQQNQYRQRPGGWKVGPVGSGLGGAYLGYALGGPVGGVLGGVAGYGLGKLLGPQKQAQVNPRAFTYYRDESGKVQRYLPSASDVDVDDMTPEQAQKLNADTSHPYVYTQDQHGNWHTAKKGAQRYGYGQQGYGQQGQQQGQRQQGQRQQYR